MAQWISLSEAAFQYGVNIEDVRYWIENNEIIFVSVGTTYVVDDESIQRYLSQHEVIPTESYVSTLKSMYQNLFLINQSYQEIIHIHELKILQLEKVIALKQKIEDTMTKNIELYRTLNSLENSSSIKFSWFKKLRRKINPDREAD